MNKRPYLCYTDGSCKKSTDTPGGWGLVMKSPEGQTVEKYGGAPKTTVSIMELTAITEALKLVPPSATVTIFSDSQSAIDSCTRQMDIWKKNGWKNCATDLIELLQLMDSLIREKALQVEWKWIRGHNGNQGNERADDLACQGAREAKKQLEEK